MAFNIVLVHPEIPNNTGNIGRLCLATNSDLHLIKPFGFELSESLDVFMEQHSHKKFAYLSSHGSKNHWSIPFEENLFLVFGKESVGLPSAITDKNKESLYKIPMYSDHIRSLNLANAVGIVTYEGLKHL